MYMKNQQKYNRNIKKDVSSTEWRQKQYEIQPSKPQKCARKKTARQAARTNIKTNSFQCV